MTIKEWTRTYAKVAPASTVLVLVCTAAWFISAIQARSISGAYYDSELATEWTLWGPAVLAGGAEWLRPVTSMFMHLDLGHLAVNMIFLVLIGREVERWLGSALYTAAYFCAGLGGSLAILWNAFDQPTVGASGALYGLMALMVGVYRAKGLDLRAPLFLIAANVVYTAMTPGVSLWGHVGGLVTGLVLLPFLRARRVWVRWLGVFIVGILVIAGIGLRAAVWG